GRFCDILVILCIWLVFFTAMRRLPLCSTLFPYTTLFRSVLTGVFGVGQRVLQGRVWPVSWIILPVVFVKVVVRGASETLPNRPRGLLVSHRGIDSRRSDNCPTRIGSR